MATGPIKVLENSSFVNLLAAPLAGTSVPKSSDASRHAGKMQRPYRANPRLILHIETLKS